MPKLLVVPVVPFFVQHSKNLTHCFYLYYLHFLKIHAKGGTINIYKSMRGRKKIILVFLKENGLLDFQTSNSPQKRNIKIKRKLLFRVYRRIETRDDVIAVARLSISIAL